MSIFTEEFVKSLPEDDLLAAKRINDRFFEVMHQYPEAELHKYDDLLIDAYAFLMAFLEARPLPWRVSRMGFHPHANENIKQVLAVFRSLGEGARTRLAIRENDAKVEKAKEKYSAQLGQIFSYEFSDTDLQRVQKILNSLRDLISQSTFIEDDHKRRLLKRVERVQTELHKKVSDLDRFWGLVGDAGVVLGKFGNDAKPIVDRIRELAGVIWRVQAKAEQLPEGNMPPLLGIYEGGK